MRKYQDFETDLIQVVELMSKAINSGMSLNESIKMVGELLDSPLSQHFSLISKKIESGLNTRSALLELKRKINDKDFDLLINAIDIQLEQQGSLAKTLWELTTILEDRKQIKQLENDRFIKVKIKNLETRKELSNFMDLLSIVSEDAISLETSIQNVCNRVEGNISKEFRKTLLDISLGLSRDVAFKNLSTRINIPEVTTIVAQIRQSEIFGVGLIPTIKVQATKIRHLTKMLLEIRQRKFLGVI